jgi:hypothetical protein
MYWLVTVAGCANPPAPGLVFVRDGVIAPAGDGQTGRPLGGDRVLVERPWTPGETVRSGTVTAVAPATPECVELWSVRLGNVDRIVASGGEPPDTSLAFSPGATRLAIGAYTGEVLVADGWTGEVIARRTLPEAIVKAVAWSADGSTLYAAEQSADATLHALDPATLADRWTISLSDYVGRSAPPAGDDLYGVYTLPGTFGLTVVDGDLLVSAVHGWVDATGRHNRSRLLRLHPDGTFVVGWPADGAADATLFYPRVDGDLVAVPVGRSAEGPPPDLPIDGVQLLDLGTLAPRGSVRAEPLKPWFDRVFIWEAADVDERADLVVAGLGDGRLLGWHLDGKPRFAVDLGVPTTTGGVPIAASIGQALVAGDRVLTLTGATSIPYGAADPSLRPPSAHPNANALFAVDLDGKLAWTWRGPHDLQGMSLSPNGRTLVVGAGPRRSDERRDLFGALVFRLDGDGSGDDRLRTFCATAAPVFFRQGVTDDGRIAVAEHPWLAADGTVQGAYRVTVLR